MRRPFPYRAEALTLLALIAAPFILPHLGFTPTTINRILIWGMVGIGFDLLFGYTGLLSFGQSAFFGSGGMFAAYLLTQSPLQNTLLALLIGTVAAGVLGYLVGMVALRRTGIYFAMITVAIAEVFFYLEFNPLSDFTGGENGLAGVPSPSVNLGFTLLKFDSNLSMYAFFAFWYFVALALALRIVRSPFGLVLRAIRENPLRAEPRLLQASIIPGRAATARSSSPRASASRPAALCTRARLFRAPACVGWCASTTP